MKNKNLILVLLLGIGFALSSCGAKSARLGNIDPDEIEYMKDCRTNLCYAVVGAERGSHISGAAESMGMSCVPCDSLKNVNVKSNCE